LAQCTYTRVSPTHFSPDTHRTRFIKMGLSPKVKQTLHYINPFKPPKEAEEAGYADFRPVSGWRRESVILAIWNVADEI
jgi:hypothetical protein